DDLTIVHGSGLIRRPRRCTPLPYTTLFRAGAPGPSRARGLPRGGRLMLAVDSLTVSHGPVAALRGVSFSAARGAITAVLGANGISEEHTSELHSRENLVCRLLLEKKKTNTR